MEQIIKVSKAQEDLSSIMKLGDQFYFVASSDITDTNKVKKSMGRMVIGRLIDETMLRKLREMTDSNISLSTINNTDDEVAQELLLKAADSVSLQQLVELNKEKDTIQVEYIISNTDYEGYSVRMTITKTRDLFVGGMNQIKNLS